MNTVNKYYADPNISRRIIGPDFVASALPNKFLMESKPAASQRTQVIATPKALNTNSTTTVRGTKPANSNGESSNISAPKNGCATESRGLDEAPSSQNGCCHDSCDSFSLSPQAMLINVMREMAMMNMMNSGMMPNSMSAFEQASMMSGGFNSPCMNSGMGFNSPMQMMNPGFGLNFPMNASWSFSSFSAFWGNGQF